jgi:ABC-type maltose transport system permease subunit
LLVLLVCSVLVMPAMLCFLGSIGETMLSNKLLQGKVLASHVVLMQRFFAFLTV